MNMDPKSTNKKIATRAARIVEPVKDQVGNSAFHPMCVYPELINFSGKNSDENIILFLRRHPASLIWHLFAILILLIAPFFFIAVVKAFGYESASLTAYSFGILLLFAMILFTYIIDLFIKWYYSVNIVTDMRIVDVDFSNVMYHRFSEASLKQIQDVTHSVHGVLGSMFDYGSVFVQTAATRPEFEFYDIPRPRDVQEVIVNLLEEKEKEGN